MSCSRPMWTIWSELSCWWAQPATEGKCAEDLVSTLWDLAVSIFDSCSFCQPWCLWVKIVEIRLLICWSKQYRLFHSAQLVFNYYLQRVPLTAGVRCDLHLIYSSYLSIQGSNSSYYVCIEREFIHTLNYSILC